MGERQLVTSPSKIFLLRKSSIIRSLVILGFIFIFLIHFFSLLSYPSPHTDDAWAASRAWGFINTGLVFGPLDSGVIDRFEGYWTVLPWISTIIQSFVMRLFDAPTLFAIRITSLAAGVLLLATIYSIGSRFGGKNLGLLSILITSLSKPFFLSAHLGRSDIFAATLGFSSIALYLRKDKFHWYVSALIGIILGLALEIHLHSIIFLFAVLFLFWFEYRFQMFFQKAFWGFTLGLIAGILIYLAIHVIPYPQTYFKLNKVLFSDTHTPPILTFNPEIILESLGSMLFLLLAGYTLLPIGIWSAVRIVKSRNKKFYELLGINIVFLLAYIFLIRNKFLNYYAILITPTIDVLVAVFILEFLNKPMKNKKEVGIRYLMVVIICISFLFPFIISQYKNDPWEDYSRVQEKISKQILPNESIMANQLYWFGLNNHNYYSWETLSYYQRYKPESSLEEAFLEFKPDVFIIDSHVANFVVDGSGSNLYTEHLGLPRSDLEAILNKYAHLDAIIQEDTYGPIYIYRFDWEKVVYSDEIRDLPITHISLNTQKSFERSWLIPSP